MRPQNGRARLVRGTVGRPSAGAACPKSARSGPVAAGWPAARPAPPDPPPGSARTSTATIRPTQTRTRSRASWSWSRRSAGPRCPEGGDGGLGDRLVPVAPGRQQCGGAASRSSSSREMPRRPTRNLSVRRRRFRGGSAADAAGGPGSVMGGTGRSPGPGATRPPRAAHAGCGGPCTVDSRIRTRCSTRPRARCRGR
jgi:hypothetical protein